MRHVPETIHHGAGHRNGRQASLKLQGVLRFGESTANRRDTLADPLDRLEAKSASKEASGHERLFALLHINIDDDVEHLAIGESFAIGKLVRTAITGCGSIEHLPDRHAP